jgi:hypothetical protein
MEKEKACYFMKDGATTHTANYFINVLNEVFEEVTDYSLQTPDLNRSDFYLLLN